MATGHHPADGTTLAPMNLGGPELIILVGIAVLLFGAGWLPKAARNLGKAKVEFDEVQKQFNETKDSVVEASGVKEIEATVRKANKAINTSPQKLLKDAAKSAVTSSSDARSKDVPAPDADDDIEDAEIVEPVDEQPSTTTPKDDTNINLDFR